MQRILQNLVSNAVRYTEAGGVLIAVRRRGGLCRIDVVDTGRGIPEEEQALVFEEFFRGTGEGEDAGGPGLGLGLSIVQRMALALGHTVRLHSRPGRGTRMSLELPLADAAPDAQVHTAPVATTLTGARVLVIENDASTAEALERLLRGWDAQVESHRALSGVVESLKAGMRRPDVMIIDYHLSDGACGLDVVDHLKRERDWIAPVIVTTADYGVDVGRRVTEARAELMLKPVKPAQLRALLAYLLA
jgi:CheY-like chemotaxis protein